MDQMQNWPTTHRMCTPGKYALKHHKQCWLNTYRQHFIAFEWLPNESWVSKLEQEEFLIAWNKSISVCFTVCLDSSVAYLEECYAQQYSSKTMVKFFVYSFVLNFAINDSTVCMMGTNLLHFKTLQLYEITSKLHVSLKIVNHFALTQCDNTKSRNKSWLRFVVSMLHIKRAWVACELCRKTSVHYD